MTCEDATAEQPFAWKQLLVAAAVWFGVAAVVVPFVYVGLGVDSAVRCLSVGGVVGLATILAWLAASVVSGLDGVGPASTLVGMLVRLGVTVAAVIALVSVAHWDRRLVGFSAIAWHLPLLAVDSLLMARRLMDARNGATLGLVDPVSGDLVSVEVR